MNQESLTISLALKKDSINNALFFPENPIIHIRTFEDFKNTYELLYEELARFVKTLNETQNCKDLILIELSSFTYKLMQPFLEIINNDYKIFKSEMNNNITLENQDKFPEERIRIRMIQKCLILEILSKFVYKANYLLQHKDKKEKKNIYKIKEINSNIDFVLQIYNKSFLIEGIEIFYYPQTSEYWSSILPFIQRDTTKLEKYEERFKSLCSKISTIFAAGAKGIENTSNLAAILSTGIHAAYYMLFKNASKYQFQKTIIQSMHDLLSRIQNIQKHDLVETVMKLISPSNKHHFSIIVPKLCKHITLDSLKEDNKEIEFIEYSNPQEYKTKFKKINFEKYSYLWFVSNFRVGPDKNKEINCKAIIFYIHGGGFVFGSPQACDIFTRKWSKKTGFPIFAVKYRLAPKDKFPSALDDVFQAYYWIIQFCQSILKINYEKIIVSGDSAGGNLSLALCTLCIQKGIRRPDALLLAYPACILSQEIFVPSNGRSFDDYMLFPQLIKLMLEFYVDASVNNNTNPYVTPLSIHSEILKKFPPTRMIISGLDPLRDGSYALLYRLRKNNVDAKLMEFTQLPHGFLNMIKTNLFEAKIALNECIKALNELANI